ncbi:MAG: hypothetical protein Alpg2KO_11090 [Alphaproteobacteria bacterium]
MSEANLRTIFEMPNATQRVRQELSELLLHITLRFYDPLPSDLCAHDTQGVSDTSDDVRIQNYIEEIEHLRGIIYYQRELRSPDWTRDQLYDKRNAFVQLVRQGLEHPSQWAHFCIALQMLKDSRIPIVNNLDSYIWGPSKGLDADYPGVRLLLTALTKLEDPRHAALTADQLWQGLNQGDSNQHHSLQSDVSRTLSKLLLDPQHGLFHPWLIAGNSAAEWLNRELDRLSAPGGTGPHNFSGGFRNSINWPDALKQIAELDLPVTPGSHSLTIFSLTQHRDTPKQVAQLHAARPDLQLHDTLAAYLDPREAKRAAPHFAPYLEYDLTPVDLCISAGRRLFDIDRDRAHADIEQAMKKHPKHPARHALKRLVDAEAGRGSLADHIRASLPQRPPIKPLPHEGQESNGDLPKLTAALHEWAEAQINRHEDYLQSVTDRITEVSTAPIDSSASDPESQKRLLQVKEERKKALVEEKSKAEETLKAARDAKPAFAGQVATYLAEGGDTQKLASLLSPLENSPGTSYYSMETRQSVTLSLVNAVLSVPLTSMGVVRAGYWLLRSGGPLLHGSPELVQCLAKYRDNLRKLTRLTNYAPLYAALAGLKEDWRAIGQAWHGLDVAEERLDRFHPVRQSAEAYTARAVKSFGGIAEPRMAKDEKTLAELFGEATVNPYIWPAIADNLEFILYHLGGIPALEVPDTTLKARQPEQALLLASFLPKPPEALTELLVDLALTGGARVHPYAVRALRHIPDLGPRLVKGLKARKAATRLNAANALHHYGLMDQPTLANLLGTEKTAVNKRRLVQIAKELGVNHDTPTSALGKDAALKMLPELPSDMMYTSEGKAKFDLIIAEFECPDLVWKEDNTTLDEETSSRFAYMIWSANKLTGPAKLPKLLSAFTEDSVRAVGSTYARNFMDGLTKCPLTLRGLIKLVRANNPGSFSLTGDACHPLDVLAVVFNEIRVWRTNINWNSLISDEPSSEWWDSLATAFVGELNDYHADISWHRSGPEQWRNTPPVLNPDDIRHHLEPIVLDGAKEGRTDMSDKGLLSLAALYPDPELIPDIAARLKRIGPDEFALAKALLDLLNLMDLDEGLQVVVQSASSHRMKGVRKHAVKLMGELAKRRGWTEQQLRDRSVPDFDLSAQGRGSLDYGPRNIPIQLTETLELMAEKADGKLAKTAPAPRKSDDVELAKRERRRFTAMKKELKQTLAQLEQSFFDDMVTQRHWEFTDWSRFLAGHPLLSRLCQRLVWLQHDKTGTVLSFRLSEDGGLINADGDDFAIKAGAEVTLAHRRLMSEADVSAWQDHFADYEVSAFLVQLDGMDCPLLDSAESLNRLTSVDTAAGSVINNFALRRWARENSFDRGEVIDGGGYIDYVRSFPGLNLVAHLPFEGEEAIGDGAVEHETEIKGLYFARPGLSSIKLPLSEVPPILIDLCHASLLDLHA